MKKILLIEDDSFLIDIYKSKLEGAGFSVKVARDGEEALAMTEEEKPDLLLLDIVLPILNGWEFLKRIKKSGKFKNLKIIIVSNLGQKEDEEKALKFGADKYIIKAHHTPSEIVKEVKKILNIK